MHVKRVTLVLDSTYAKAVAISYAAPRVNETSEAVSSRAAVLAPVRTGKLRASRRKVVRARRNSVTGTVTFGVKYAIWVHEGTKAHVIRRRHAQALRWEEHGLVYFRKAVRHPGTKGRPFLRTALFEEGVRRGFRVEGGGTGTVIRTVFDG